MACERAPIRPARGRPHRSCVRAVALAVRTTMTGARHTDPATGPTASAAPDAGDWTNRTADTQWSRLKRAKLALLESAERSGLSHRVRDSQWRARRLLILAYHGISLRDEHEWNPRLYVPALGLRRRFEVLRDGGYAVLPLREGVARLYQRSLPPRAVALTFDDGLYDFHAVALPLLREFAFPATVYLSSYYAARETPVFRVACRYLLWRGRHREISADGLTPAGGRLDLQEERVREDTVTAMEEAARVANEGTAGELRLLRHLAERVDVPFDEFLESRMLQLMRRDETSALPRDLIEVQLHTHRHRVPLDRALFLREIIENREYLESIGAPASAFDGFCYPSGVTRPQFLGWLRQAGVTAATTCEPGLAHARSDPLMLPRFVDSHGLTQLEFEAWTTGIATLIPRLPHRPAQEPYTSPE